MALADRVKPNENENRFDAAMKGRENAGTLSNRAL